MILPQEYIVQKFYQYVGYPKYKKLSRTYEGCCPICREGKSWGKKRRCYYIIDDNIICCHNCGWYSSPLNWIQQVSGQDKIDILNEAQKFDIVPLDILTEKDKEIPKPKKPTLPADSINLFDRIQVEFYKDNKIVCDALALIKTRRLDTAINKPDSLWLSLSDKVHKNRIIIPFYNDTNEIIFYQSRAIYQKDTHTRPKYLGKINGERSLFNLNKIQPDLDYIFIFEGPIDACFVKNGIAVAGIQEHSYKHFTPLQQEQLLGYKFYKKIWVLDSQWQDKASKHKTKKLLDDGETVFIWPEELGKKVKDINEVCAKTQRDFIDPNFFIKNSYSGLKGRLLLSVIDR